MHLNEDVTPVRQRVRRTLRIWEGEHTPEDDPPDRVDVREYLLDAEGNLIETAAEPGEDE